MKTFVVIMAGGSGERFWPYSRITNPKQLLKLTSANLTMIEEAIVRIEPLVPRERILVITSKVLRDTIAQVCDLPNENIIAEPAKRNTAPCLALAAAIIKQRCAAVGEHDAVMAVLTADHFIGDAHAFRANISVAIETAVEHGALVTLGIRPTRPETGYGYIEMNRGIEEQKNRGVPVVSFREKPDAELAFTFLRYGNFLWNSGMFFWKVSSIESAMLKYLPEVGAFISSGDDESFKRLPDISIDYGIMEKADNVYVVPASFPWDDVGSWDALDRMKTHDADHNVLYGNVEVIDTTNSIIYNVASNEKVLSIVGMNDAVVVFTDDAVLVCDKSKAQDVKRIVSALRSKGKTDVL